MTKNASVVKRYVYVWEGPVRISHWLNFFCIIVLSLTGAYIHYPFITVTETAYAPYLMGIIRFVHYLCGIVFTFGVVMRLIWLFIGNQYSSWKAIPNPFKKADRDMLIHYIKYYIFLEKNPPHTLAHNPVALLAYIVLFFLFILQIITGFALWAQANPDGTLFALTGWIFNIVSNQWVRFYHYILMYLVAGFLINHIYSAIIFDFKSQSGEISAIFSGWKAEK
jgi:Ni/Fe-hydrogenase 1 B-type cytochrome subunit